ncbi:DUF5685 family protein [[Clostridium] innocuum]|nr:DUF5685 family protein [[Clostridium] innocuum]
MFGYIVVNKPELKIKDFDTYQSFYCGLCKALHEDFGRRGQLTLNFDLTFLAILLTALYEPKDQIVTERCVVHPLHCHVKRDNAYIRYAADMTIILTYLKCEDDWKDEHRLQAKTMLHLLKRHMRRMEQAYPDKIKSIRQALEKTAQLEKEQSRDLDQLSAQSGIMMAEIVTYKQDEWYDVLFRLGDYLGRFIYIMDAYDDVEEDRKQGQFNPFLEECERDGFDERVKIILELMISNSADAFETLPILQHADILRNILYAGIWTKYEMVRKKRTGEKDG